MTTPNLLAATSLTQGQLNTPALLASGEVNAYQVASGKAVKVATASLCNTSGSSVTVSVSVVPSGGTAGALNRIISAFALSAGNSITQEDGLAGLMGAMLGEGQFISVNSSAGSAITLNLTGVLTA